MKDLAYTDNGSTIIGLPIVSKKNSISNISGYIYLRVSYKSEQISNYYIDQLKFIKSVSQINKFNYFDSILATDFNLTCHYGCLEVVFASLDIPTLQSSNLYIVKLKEGAH
jgi:hypothetical protein